MNKLKIFFLLLPFIGMGAWAMYYATFVRHSDLVTLPIAGYDPRNILSGHYIDFRIDWANADCMQLDWDGVCPKGDFANISHQYYVHGGDAKRLERLINNNQIKAEIVFAYRKGSTPLAQKLLLDGQPWDNYLRTHK